VSRELTCCCCFSAASFYDDDDDGHLNLREAELNLYFLRANTNILMLLKSAWNNYTIVCYNTTTITTTTVTTISSLKNNVKIK